MPTMYEYVNDFSVKELERRYAKLRAKFNKRIERLYEESPSDKIRSFKKGGYKYRLAVSDIQKLPDRNTWSNEQIKKDWAVRLAEIESLLEARSLSLSGLKAIRRDTIATLRQRGYSAINNSNFDAFTAAMNYLKSIGILQQYDSDKVAEAVDTYLDGGQIEDSELAEIISSYFSAIDDSDIFN